MSHQGHVSESEDLRLSKRGMYEFPRPQVSTEKGFVLTLNPFSRHVALPPLKFSSDPSLISQISQELLFFLGHAALRQAAF